MPSGEIKEWNVEMRGGRARARLRAMTLLEVVLAVSVLAATLGLVAGLFSDGRRWAATSAAALRGERLARSIDLLREQWADRRTTVPLDERGASVRIDPGRLEFVTAHPLLLTGWPLVCAAYQIESDDQARGAAERWRLVYRERAVSDVKRAPADTSAAPEAPVASLVLLRGCDGLEWQEARALGSEDTVADGGLGWGAVRPIATEHGPAIRLYGRMDGGEFACVLIVAGWH